MELMQNLWNPEYQKLMRHSKKDTSSGPNLALPDLSRRFYISIDWSKDVMGAVFLQADVSAEARKLEAKNN